MAVTDLEERIIFVDIASPASQEVAPQVDEERQDLLVAPCVAAMEGVRRHPVGAFHEDWDSVNLEQELARFFDARGFGANQFDLAHAHRVLARGQCFPSLKKLRRHLVKIGIAIAVGPPQPGVRDFHLEASGGKLHLMHIGECGLATTPLDLQPQLGEQPQISREFIRNPECGTTRLRRECREVQVGDFVRSVNDEFHRTPEARRYRARHNVPAVGVGRPPDPNSLLVRLSRGDRVCGVIQLPGCFNDGGAQSDRNYVGSRPGQHSSHIEVLLHHRIRRLSQLLAIYPVGGKAVHAMKAKFDPPSSRFFGGLKLMLIPPLIEFVGTELRNVFGKKQVSGQLSFPGKVQRRLARD